LIPKEGTTKRMAVYQQLRSAIQTGTFAAGARLPPTREHAKALGVGRNTVLWAVDRLRAEGYLHTRMGDGSYVAPDLARTALPRRHALVRPLQPAAVLSQRGRRVADGAWRWQPPATSAVAFRIGAPEVQTFPFALWDRLAKQTTPRERAALAQYLDPAGLPALREAIAQWLWASRGIPCRAEQVLVTSGSQQAIDLVARMLLDDGDEVWVEDPGYPGIRANLAGPGAVVRPVPVDAQGLSLASAQQRWPAAKLAVVTPTHQFPLGVRMSLARRLALIEWARKTKAWLIEDDYDGEFQYGTHRSPALCSLPHDGRVIYIGTFSKTLHPGLRLGFLLLPETLVAPFATAKALCDRHSPGDAQAVLARFITEGHLLRHLRRMRELYATRQALLIDALHKTSRGAVQLQPCEHGMHLVHEVAQGADDGAVSAAAQALGVTLVALSRYALLSPRRGFVLGYAGYAESDIRSAARRVGPLMAALSE
jgi:GntR family transcriptional regulator / MocR family aminotransferase